MSSQSPVAPSFQDLPTLFTTLTQDALSHFKAEMAQMPDTESRLFYASKVMPVLTEMGRAVHTAEQSAARAEEIKCVMEQVDLLRRVKLDVRSDDITILRDTLWPDIAATLSQNNRVTRYLATLTAESLQWAATAKEENDKLLALLSLVYVVQVAPEGFNFALLDGAKNPRDVLCALLGKYAGQLTTEKLASILFNWRLF
jgi:hypothetical protein